MNTNVSAAGSSLWGSGDDCASNDEFRIQSDTGDGDGFRFRVVDGTDTTNYDIATNLSTGLWKHVVFVSNKVTDELEIWVDGINLANNTDEQAATIDLDACPIYLGADNDGGGTPLRFSETQFDLFGFWSRALSADEISDLYNGGTGITPPLTPVINILLPLSITYNETITQLNYTVDNADRCWYTVDEGITNSTDVPAGDNFTQISNPGSNTWTVYCNNSDGVGLETSIFFINQSVNVEQISPLNNTKFNVSVINFSVNTLPINTNLKNITLRVYNFSGEIAIQNLTLLSGSSLVQTNFTTNLIDGNYRWNIRAVGENTTVNETGNRTFHVHTQESTLEVFDPVGSIDFIKIGNNLTLNWSVTEPGENMTAHIQNCTYEYNGVLTVLNNTLCTEINQTSFLYVNGVNNLTFTVIDEFNLTTTNITTWSVEVIELNQTFNSPVVELSTQDFSLLTNVNGSVTSVNLIYNGTTYSANIFDLGGDITNITSSFQIPSFEADTNVTFYYNLSMLSGSTIIVPNRTQEIIVLFIGNCSAFSNVLFNLSLFDEKVLDPIFGTIEVDIEILNAQSQEISTKSTDFFNVTNASVCTNINLTAAANLYSAEIRYYVDPLNNSNFQYVPEFYHIQNAQTANLPQEIDLYDLNINESTEFTIFYRDNDYISRSNVLLQIQRKYVNEGIFRTVEIPITSSEGSITGHFDLNNYKYKIIVTENGEILNVFDNPAIACESELSGICTLTLNGQGSPETLENVETINDLSFSIVPNGTEVTVSYVVPSGETKEVMVAMVQTSPFKDPTILCNQTISSSAGSFTCTVNATIGDSQVFVDIDADNSIVSRKSIYYQEDLGDFFLLNNYAIASLFIILMVTMMVSSPMIMVFAATFSVAMLGFLFLLKGSSIGLVLGSMSWLLISGIIILLKLNKKDEQ